MISHAESLATYNIIGFTSHTWSYVAYGLVGLLALFIGVVVFMIHRATQEEKNRGTSLPQLAESEIQGEMTFFFDNESSLGDTQDAQPKQGKSGINRPFLRKSGKETKGSTSGNVTADSDLPFFEEGDDFTLADGSDMNTKS